MKNLEENFLQDLLMILFFKYSTKKYKLTNVLPRLKAADNSIFLSGLTANKCIILSL